MAHANARLGPAGRRELVRLMIVSGSGRRGGRPPCFPSRPRRRIGGSDAGWPRAPEQRGSGAWALGSLEPAASLTDAGRAPAIEARVLCRARADRLGAAVDRRRDRGGALDRARDPAPPRLLASATRAARAVRALRVAVPGRSGAHGRQALPALPSARARCSPAIDATGPASRCDTRSARSTSTPIVDDHTPPGLRRAARRRARRHRHRVLRARAGLVRRPRHHRPAGDDRRRLELHATTAACASCSPSARSATSSPRPTPHAGTAKSNASTRPWNANGPTASATATAPPATARCHTGSTTTTSADPTAHSAADPRSPALTTSPGTTPTQQGVRHAAPSTADSASASTVGAGNEASSTTNRPGSSAARES